MVPDDTMFVIKRRPSHSGPSDRIDMRLTAIAVLCTCMLVCGADVVHLRKSKAKLLGRIAGRHHKRGVLSALPPFKLGHDIPHVTHSVIKPVVVSYPPTASVSAVKVPLSHPLLPRYPVPVGHKVPVPHPHYGLKFPHHTKSVVLPKPDQHYHHHHHHVAPRPVFPVVPAPLPATPLVPVPAPTAPVALPVPAPSPPVLPAPIIPQPSPLPPPLPVLPPHHFHVRPFLPAPAPIAPPLFTVPPQLPYVIRPGNAVQTSLFATHPRFPFFPNFQIPLSQSAVSQLVPHQYLFPQGAPEGVLVNQAAPAPAPVPLEPTPTLVHGSGEVPQPGGGVHLEPGVHYHAQPDVHVHPAQPEIHVQAAQPGLHLHPDQPEYLEHGVQVNSAQPEFHFQPGVSVQPDVHLHVGGGQPHPDFHLQPAHPHVHLQPANPEFHLQQGHSDFHFQHAHPEVHLQPGHHPDFHLQPVRPDVGLQHGHPDVHLQPAGHPDIHLQPQPAHPEIHAHQAPSVDHNGWSPVPTQPHEPPYPADGHQLTQEQGSQGYDQHEDQYHEYQHQLQHHIQQQLEQAQYEQQFHEHRQPSSEYGVPQGDYPQQHQGAEGRSAEGATGEDDPQLYHNHIPLGLQPPIDRPLDHFR